LLVGTLDGIGPGGHPLAALAVLPARLRRGGRLLGGRGCDRADGGRTATAARRRLDWRGRRGGPATPAGRGDIGFRIGGFGKAGLAHLDIVWNGERTKPPGIGTTRGKPWMGSPRRLRDCGK